MEPPAGDHGDDAGVDALLAEVTAWAGDERRRDAAASRARERWLRQAAAEDARFAGTVLDLAEERATVVVRTTAGTSLRGCIAAVGRDFLVVRGHGERSVFVRFVSVATVRPEPGHRSAVAASERRGPLPATLADVLARLAADRPRVRLGVEGASEAVCGELRAVGHDVATVRLEGDPAGLVYVHLDAVRDLTVVG